MPQAVTEIEFERIPLSDGVHLSCRYWLPDDANENPVPAMARPPDQRPDDDTSACFDGAALEEAFTILGAPVVNLHVAADQENAFVCVRLNEVLSSGESLQISYGILNLTHRNSHEFPEALELRRRYSVRVQLNDIAHTFAPGSRIRIAISTTFWPIVWPSPCPATVSLFTAASTLELPVREPRSSDAQARPLAPPRHSRVHPTSTLVDPEPRCLTVTVGQRV